MSGDSALEALLTGVGGGRLLSRWEALAEINAEQLKVEYALKITKGAVELRDEPVTLGVGPEGSEILDKQYFGNRLGITLGPVVRSNTYRRKRGRQKFRGRNWVFDLTKTGGKFTIYPGESVTVNSLEYVELGPSLGAITMARLTHATAGLVLSPSYIDPLWSGILVYEMTNVSSQPFTLQVGEKIGACHFYKVDTTNLTQDDTRKFADKSHHFGQNWGKILDGDVDPFPQKKLPVGIADDEHLGGGWLRRNWRSILNYAGATAIIGFLIAIGSAMPEIATLRDLPTRVTALDEELNAISAIASNQAAAGTVSIDVPANTASATRAIEIPLKSNQRVASVIASEPSGQTEVRVGASVVGTGPDSAQVEITVNLLADAISATRITVSYAILFE